MDSSFFTGSIIYVALDTDSGLVINVNSGKVYNFTDRLELVGEITYDNERRLFIDDRDSGKLWVAGSVRYVPEYVGEKGVEGVRQGPREGVAEFLLR